jgi:hypothetical protein
MPAISPPLILSAKQPSHASHRGDLNDKQERGSR